MYLKIPYFIERGYRFLRSKSLSPEIASRIHYEDADFYKYELPDDKKFDLIYDFTYDSNLFLPLRLLY